MKLSPLACATLLLLLGCRGTYYDVMEKFGVEKRDILVDRVEEGRDAQTQAKEQFQDALEAFKSVTQFQGGELEGRYKELKSESEDAAGRVKAVNDRIDSIEQVADDLFSEWKKEIKEISSSDLKAQSQQMLSETQARYGELLKAMKRAEAKMEPVLTAFNDRVLFLKHNLNAQAIASLSAQAAEIDTKVQDLVREMEASIAEANEFIAAMDSGQ